MTTSKDALIAECIERFLDEQEDKPEIAWSEEILNWEGVENAEDLEFDRSCWREIQL